MFIYGILAASRRSLLARLRTWATFLLPVVAFLVITALGGLPAHLDRLPDADQILVFFKEPFVLFCLICLGWFISRMQAAPLRWEEFKYFNSLPLGHRQLYYHFLLSDYKTSLWAPHSISAVYAGLVVVAPWPYLLRLATACFLSHLLALLFSHALHLMWMTRPSERRNPVYRAESLITVVTIVLFAFLALAGLLFPQLISGANFWPLVIGGAIAAMVSGHANTHLFGVWLRTNNLFRAPMLAQATYRQRSSRWLQPLRDRNPWLWSHLLLVQRRRQKGLVVLTMTFVFLSYLASMNNRIWSDRSGVLLAIALSYAALFSYQVTRQMGTEGESVPRLYALPVETRSWLASMAVPALVWLLLIDLVFAGLIATYSPTLAAVFFLRAAALGALMVVMAVTLAAICFPDLKRAQRRYIYLLVAAVILSALFYRYHPWILIALLLLPAQRLLRMRYYRT